MASSDPGFLRLNSYPVQGCGVPVAIVAEKKRMTLFDTADAAS
jgi:hypothetical protein